MAAALAVLFATGIPVYCRAWFAAETVARSRDVHVLTTFALVALLAGHVYLGIERVGSPHGGIARGGASGGSVRPDPDR